MNEHRINQDYENGVFEFLKYAQDMQSLLTGQNFVLMSVVLIKYVKTWAECVIIYSSLV